MTGLSPTSPSFGSRSLLVNVVPVVVDNHCCWISIVHAWGDGISSCCGDVSDCGNSQIHSAVVDHADLEWFEAGVVEDGIHDELIIVTLQFGDVRIIQLKVGSYLG